MSKEIIYPTIVSTLYSTENLWYFDAPVKYTEAHIIKSMFIRRDTQQPLNPNLHADVDRYSVFFAMARRHLEPPLYALPKQKNQMWDFPFIDGLFRYCLTCLDSPNSKLNKIAYTINSQLTLDDLYRFKNDAKFMR